MTNSYVEAAKRVAAVIKAEALAMGDAGYERSIYRAVGPLLHRTGGRPPIPPGEREAELAGWRCRIMLFGPNGDVEADSMPDAAPEAEPDVKCGTLGLVAQWLREVAEAFHAERREPAPVGLDQATLERSILSLRVSLSRNAGQTWWRVSYKLGDDGEQWRAMVRVERGAAT